MVVTEGSFANGERVAPRATWRIFIAMIRKLGDSIFHGASLLPVGFAGSESWEKRGDPPVTDKNTDTRNEMKKKSSEQGFEPWTPSSGDWCSTTELHAHTRHSYGSFGTRYI